AGICGTRAELQQSRYAARLVYSRLSAGTSESPDKIASGRRNLAGKIVARGKRCTVFKEWTNGGICYSRRNRLRGGRTCLKEHGVIFLCNRLELWPLPKPPNRRCNHRGTKKQSVSRLAL